MSMGLWMLISIITMSVVISCNAVYVTFVVTIGMKLIGRFSGLSLLVVV